MLNGLRRQRWSCRLAEKDSFEKSDFSEIIKQFTGGVVAEPLDDHKIYLFFLGFCFPCSSSSQRSKSRGHFQPGPGPWGAEEPRDPPVRGGQCQSHCSEVRGLLIRHPCSGLYTSKK